MIKLNTVYSQVDNRWKDILLGFNTQKPYTIGGYGCLITCQAMVCEYYGFNTDPKRINELLKSVNGFVPNTGYYIWNSLSKLYDIKELRTDTPNPLTDAQIREIKNAVNSGFPVMLQIDFRPETAALDMHYVLVIAYTDNDFTIADPIDGTIKQLSKYSKNIRTLIWQYIIYEGKIKTTCEEELEETKKKLEELQNQNKPTVTNKPSNLAEALKPIVDKLDGNKTYLTVAMMVGAIIAYQTGFISEDLFNTLDMLFLALVGFSLRDAIRKK